MKSRINLVLLSILLGAATAHAQSQTITATTKEGSTVETQLSASISVNKGATLKRIPYWLTNTAIPANCDPIPEVRTHYQADRVGQYVYRADCHLQVTEPAEAYELKHVLFDIFGRHVKTLVASGIKTIPANSSQYLGDSRWNVYSENEVGLHFMSISYVSRLRLTSGKVLIADEKAIAAAVKKIVSGFEEKSLEPSAPARP